MPTVTPKKPGAPKWSTEPFEDLFSYVERQGHLLRLSRRGISSLLNIPKIIEVLQKVDIDDGVQREKALEHAKAEADLAKREVEEGFPLLYAQATITLWATLDSTMVVFLSRWIQNNKKCFLCQEMQKVKVKISEYERLSRSEKALYVVELLQRELSLTFRHGVKRHEHILKQFGLHWDVDSEVQRELIELNVVRNYIVHRRGVVDSNFKKCCPWDNIKYGQKIIITPERYRRYETAVGAYALSVIVRLGEYYGKDMKEYADACKMPLVAPLPMKS
ncbi:hypothetical protein [Humidesulfovibrio sp.]